MKNFRKYLSYIAVLGLLLTSCSKDEGGITNEDQEKVNLNFGAIVNDLVNTSKQTAVADLPECSGDEPAFVEIVLMNGDDYIVGEVEPFRIDLVDGQIFTEDVPELELLPDTYTLTHFSVHDESGDVLWLAPRSGGILAQFVEDPLPMDIVLGAGVKKYVDVPVLCYDNREVIEYGYMFFELDTMELVEFCLFVNYCDEDGRHYPARYEVDVWLGTDDSGTLIYTNAGNNVGQYQNGDFFADPLCGALPSNDDPDEEYVFLRITLLDWAEAYGDVEQMVITRTLSLDDIMANFGGNGTVNYEHLRFGCSTE